MCVVFDFFGCSVHAIAFLHGAALVRAAALCMPLRAWDLTCDWHACCVTCGLCVPFPLYDICFRSGVPLGLTALALVELDLGMRVLRQRASQPARHHSSPSIITIFFIAALFAPTAPMISSEEGDDMLPAFRRVDEVVQVVRQHLYRPVSNNDLWNGAMRGMITSVDPQARYLSPEQRRLEGLGQGPNGEREGFGFDWRADHR